MNTTNDSYTRGAALVKVLGQRIAVLDGAMGTMIQRYQLCEADYRGTRFADAPSDLKGNNELLQITRPNVIREIHEQYLAAGCDIIETNTFGATRIAQQDYGLGQWAPEMNVEAARIARGYVRQVQHCGQARALPPGRWAPHHAPRASAPT